MLDIIKPVTHTQSQNAPPHLQWQDSLWWDFRPVIKPTQPV